MIEHDGKMARRGCRRQRGLSLVELMIAMTISTVLIAGILQVFSSNNAAFRTQQAVSRVQENARFGFRFIAREMRHAGYNGCAGNTRIINLLDVEEGGGYDDLYNFNTSVRGYYLAHQNLPDHLGISSPPPLADTDVVVIRRSGRDRVSAVRKQPNTNSANFKVDPGHSLEPEDIITVSNCRKSWIVQAINVQRGQGNGNGNGGDHETIVINANNGQGTTPGNRRKLRKNLGKDFSISKAGVIMFYIGENVEGRPALYRKVNSDPAEELVAGVEHLRVRYGVDSDIEFLESEEGQCVPDSTAGDGEVDEYKDAHEIADSGCAWARVIGARMVFLVRSRSDRVLPEDEKQEYVLFDEDNPVTHRDGHLRHRVNTTVSFRNKTL